nr:MAG TPA: anaerobic ribonucleoside-triphosphate reductase activating protein [Bacteriophage sp.]
MNYGNIKFYDIANGEGIRTSLFVSGCTNHCQGCFNEEAQDFNYGQLYTIETERIILEQISKPYIAGLSILGGDPLCQTVEDKLDLLSLVTKTRSLHKTTWLWTGFTWEEAITNVMNRGIFALCDVVVDGPFIEAQKDLTLAFRGSSNQRIIDVQKTIAQDKIILYKQ